MFGISFPELMIILLVALLLFGGYKNIPELAKNLGRSFGAFKKGLKESGEEENKGKAETSVESEKKKE